MILMSNSKLLSKLFPAISRLFSLALLMFCGSLQMAPSSKRGLGATLYVTRDHQLFLAGFFSAKLRKHQVTWLPCEVEALSIAAAVKHFCPLIIQSQPSVATRYGYNT